MIDIFSACDVLAKRLMENDYLSTKALGAGTDMMTGDRDFDYESGKNRLDVETANEFIPYGYKVTNVRYFNSHNHPDTEYCNVTVGVDKEAWDEIEKKSAPCRRYDTAKDAIAAYTKNKKLHLSPEVQNFIQWLFEKPKL